MDGERVAELDDGSAPEDKGAAERELDAAIKRSDRTLIRWLTQKFGDVETARDIAQSAYLRVWRFVQTQKADNLQALIFKTAANLAANEFRARRRLRAVRVDPEAAGESAVEQVACGAPSPEAAAVARQEVAASLRAIDSLPEQARRAFILSRFEERTYREIAVILGVSESSVEKYIIAALRALRDAAEEAGPRAVVRLPSRRDRDIVERRNKKTK
jgi:RNA polymerase sigma-70 factor (ECF subfamily)